MKWELQAVNTARSLLRAWGLLQSSELFLMSWLGRAKTKSQNLFISEKPWKTLQYSHSPPLSPVPTSPGL